MKWVVEEIDRQMMDGGTVAIEFESLKALIEYLKRFVSGDVGLVGSYSESDIIEIRPIR